MKNIKDMREELEKKKKEILDEELVSTDDNLDDVDDGEHFNYYDGL